MEIKKKRKSRLTSVRRKADSIKRLTERDQIWFDLLHDHGAQSTAILTAYTAHLYQPRSVKGNVFRADYKYHDIAVKRLGRLCDAGYLVKVAGQFDTAKAERNHLILDLSPSAREELTDNSPFSPIVKAGLVKHDVMTPAITASIAFMLKGTGIHFIPQHVILAMRAESLKIDDVIGKRRLTPDGIFGLRYQNGKNRYFCVEADRGTEPEESQDPSRVKDIRSNYLLYRELIGQGLYRAHFGIGDSSGMVVLNVTTKKHRVENMVDVAVRASKSGKSTFSLYQHSPDFGSDSFIPPKKILSYLVTNSWLRAGHEPFNILTPPQ